jgi:hypothetical protein
VIDELWLVIFPSAVDTLVSSPLMAVPLAEILLLAVANDDCSEVMSLDWLVIVPSAEVTRVVRPEIADALVVTFPSAVVRRESSEVIEEPCTVMLSLLIDTSEVRVAIVVLLALWPVCRFVTEFCRLLMSVV